jgi:hypothetical protein
MGSAITKVVKDNPAIFATNAVQTPPPPKLVQDYFKSEFYDPMAKGTQAIIPVKLPTGEEYKFVGGAPLVGFQEYLKNIDELPAAIIGANEGKPEYRYPTFFEQREGSDVQPYITSQDILSKESYKKRLDPMSFLATLPSYVGVVKPPETPRVPGPPRIENLSKFFDFLSPDFTRRRSLLSESEAEERIPVGMKDGGIMSLQMGGVPMEMDYRQSGGFVPLGAREKADDVPARLSKNEFVMTADAVRGMGQGDINKGAQRMYDIMNNYETIGRSLA